MNNTALIVIDLQNDLCHDNRRSTQFAERLPNILVLIEAFQRVKFPIVYTRFILPPDDPQFLRFGDRYCIEHTPGADLISELSPLAGRVVTKRKHSAFFETDLDSILTEQEVRHVVLCGLQTQICVLLTAADAYHRGYDVTVAEDSVISTRDGVRLDAVEWIERYVGRSATSAAVVADLE